MRGVVAFVDRRRRTTHTCNVNAITLQVPDRLNVHMIWPNIRFIGQDC